MKKTLFLLFCFLFTLKGTAQFSGSGSGTSSDPYLIFNPIQLDQVRNFLNQENVYFELKADIDMKQWINDNNSTEGWSPIGVQTAPFKGHFNGKQHKITNLFINRPNTDDVGLFGYAEGANFNNISLSGNVLGKDNCAVFLGRGINVFIDNVHTMGNLTGKKYVGGIIGFCEYTTDKDQKSSSIVKSSYRGDIKGVLSVGGLSGILVRQKGYKNSATIKDCYTITNINTESDCAGGLIGYIWIHAAKSYSDAPTTITISDCYSISDITSNGDYTGGLIGKLHAVREGANEYIDMEKITFSIDNNYFNGKIYAKNHVGGIVGHSESFSHQWDNETSNKFTIINIIKNYANAIIFGVQNVGGIVGHATGYTTNIMSNVAINKYISATTHDVGRILGGFDTKITIGESGTNDANKSLTTTEISSNGVTPDVSDNKRHGTNVGLSTLKIKASYQGIGWDFSNKWKIQETECLPYKVTQTAPPIVLSGAINGNTSIKGKSVDGGKVFLKIKDKLYSTDCINNNWEITTPVLQAGEELAFYAIANGKSQSYYTKVHVKYLGEGTVQNPYLVRTVEDLRSINGKWFYKLTNDIDLTEWITKNSPKNGWIPIGKNSVSSVHFNGNNHTITGLWINASEDYNGLFADCSNAVIENLNIETIKGINGNNYTAILAGKTTGGEIRNCNIIGNVSGKDYIGALVGSANNTKINKCSAQGKVNGTNYVGGLIGNSSGAPVNSSSYNGEVTSTGASSTVGGLIGKTNAEVSLSFNQVVVKTTGSTSTAGGLIGTATNNAHISNSYSIADVTSTQYVGGLVGYNYGNIDKCYASGNLRGTNVGAGIVGYNDGTAAVTSNCVAANKIINVSDARGIAMRIIGGYKNGAPDPLDNNFALKSMAVSVNDIPQKIYDDLLNGKAKTEEELKQPATYKLLGWDMTNVWTIEGGLGYPTLRDNASTTEPDTGGGNEGGNEGGGETPEIVDSPNTLLIKNTSANTGTQLMLPVEMTNRDDIIGFQFELCLPKGITAAENIDGYLMELAPERGSYRTHTLTADILPNGNIQVLCYSNKNTAFKNHEGKLMDIALNIGQDILDGTYAVALKNIVLTDAKKQSIEIAQISGNIEVSSYTLGDVNNDHKINVSDIACIVSFIMQSDTQGLIQAAADVNQDSKINVSDIAGVVDIIMTGGIQKTLAFTPKTRSVVTKDRANLEIIPFAINKGEKKTIELMLNNPEDQFVGMECDLYLPEGITIDQDPDGLLMVDHAGRTSYRKFTVDANYMPGGYVKVLLYTTKDNTFINGNSGALLTLDITADGNASDRIDDIQIKNVVLSHIGGKTDVQPADSYHSMAIGNPSEQEVVLRGHFTKEALNTFSTVLNNTEITSVDFTGASEINGTATFNVANPNALIYLAEGQSLANENNVVIANKCASLLLTDGYSFNANKSFIANNATYTRNVTKDGWYSICLPYAADIPANALVEEFVSFNANQTIVNFNETAAMEANVPYIFKAGENTTFSASNVEVPVSANLNKDLFIGTFTMLPEGSVTGKFALRNDGSGFGVCTANAYVPAFRAYLNADVMAKTIKLNHGDTTGIEEMSDNEQLFPADVYSADGKLVRKDAKNLNGLPSGIYIINNKKVIK